MRIPWGMCQSDWIPAYAGMTTSLVAGMTTSLVAGMTTSLVVPA